MFRRAERSQRFSSLWHPYRRRYPIKELDCIMNYYWNTVNREGRGEVTPHSFTWLKGTGKLPQFSNLFRFICPLWCSSRGLIAPASFHNSVICLVSFARFYAATLFLNVAVGLRRISMLSLTTCGGRGAISPWIRVQAPATTQDVYMMFDRTKMKNDDNTMDRQNA